MTLTVVHVVRTGHAVGLLAGAGLPAAPKLEDLVGPEKLVLHLRGSDTTTIELPLLVAGLGVVPVPDPQPGQVDPLAYGLDSTGKALTALARWGTGSPVALTATMATVSVTTPPQEDAAVVLVLDNGIGALNGTLAAKKSSVDLPIVLPLKSGSPHGWLLLLAGWVGRTGTSTVS